MIVDTAYFRGNYPESCSLEACAVEGYPTPEELKAAPWVEVLPRSPLEGNAKNRFPIERETGRVTHLRFNIYPDGGVARLRVYGEVAADWRRLTRHGGEMDLAAAADQHRRRRFAVIPDGLPDVAEVKPLAGRKQGFKKQIAVILAAGPITHARLNIFPDGGVARLRLFGTVSPLDRLNAMSSADAESELLACCGSRAWAHRMAGSRPFRNAVDLQEKSAPIWQSLGREDWLEAFAAHPRIGEKGGRWSQQEQAGTRGAAVKTFVELAVANHEYESRFDHIFIVCATGKSAEEMLGLLRARLDNDPETELRVAAEEQRKITNLRLERLLA